MKGRTALITGAAGGLGTHIAETILEIGGSVIMVDYPDSDYSLIKNRIKCINLFINTFFYEENFGNTSCFGL